MRDALKIHDADITLLEWGKKHPEVLDYLVEFAKSRILDADSWNEKLDRSNDTASDDTMKDKERDAYVLGRNYEPARDALLLAEKLDPTSPKIQRLLARTEQAYAKSPADFLEAHSRLSAVIKWIVDNAQDSRAGADELFYCRQLRGLWHFAVPNRS